MKWGSGKDSFVDSARFTKWRGTRYVYIYIYGGEGKKLRGRSKWYKLQPIPRIKVSKEQSHLFMDRSSARWTGYQVPLFKQGILPISSSPPLTDPPPSSRSFHSSPLPFFPLSLPFALIALFEIFTPLICVHDGNRGREGGRANPRDYFSFVIENKLRFLMSVSDGCFHYIFIVIFIVGWIDRPLDTIRKKRSMGQEVYIVQVKLPGVLILWDVRGSVTNYKNIISYVVSWITRLFRLILRIFVWRFITFREVSHICSSKYSI